MKKRLYLNYGSKGKSALKRTKKGGIMIKPIRIFLLVLMFFVFLAVNAFSAQFENYEWGISKEEAKQQIKDNRYVIKGNYNYEEDNEEVLEYEDELFGSDISVGLLFTPISKQLFGILIESEEESVGEKLKPILEKKYGEASEIKNLYVWGERDKPDLSLEYDYDTTVYYFSEYYQKFEKEYKELNEKEAEGKF